MFVEEVVEVFMTEAKEQISAIEEMAGDRGLTWAQTDALGEVRADLRAVLAALKDYREDWPISQALDWVWEKCGENVLTEQLGRDLAS